MSISEAELAQQFETGVPAEGDTATVETPEISDEEFRSGIEAAAPGPLKGNEEAVDNAVERYLEKYGGDRDAALKAAAEAQSLIGRQGSELGELRQEMQALREAVTPQQSEEPQYVPITDESLSWAQQIGSSPNFAEGAEYARKYQPALYDEIMEQAYALYPKEASRYEISLAQNNAQQNLIGQLAPVLQPLQQKIAQEQFNDAFLSVAAQNQDIRDFAPQLMTIAQENPALLQALRDGDQKTREQVIANLYYIAKGRSASPLSDVTAQAAQNLSAEAEALRRAATVGTATSQGPGTPPVQETLAGGWLDMQALHEEMGLTPEDLAG